MKKQAKRRILAFALAVCLCLGMLPTNLLEGVGSVQAAEAAEASTSGNDVSGDDAPAGGSTSGGAGDTYTFDPTELTAAADKEAIADGTTWADGYFTVVGSSMTKRVNSGAVYCVETGKTEKGNIQFTAANPATVTVVATSTGGSNTSDVALLDETGAVVAEANGVTTVTGSGDASKVTFTWNVEAGTYAVVSPTADNGGENTGRGARIYSVEVVEQKPAPVEKTDTIVFDASELTAAADKEAIADGTTWADGYFTVVGSSMTKRVSSGAVYCVETGKVEKGNIQFTVKGNAVVEVVATSTGGSNTSDVALLDDAGAVVAEANGVTTVTGSGDASKVTFTWNVTAGTYSVVSPAAENGGTQTGRGARVYSVTVKDTYTESAEVEMMTVTETFKLTDSTLVPSAPTAATVLNSGLVSLTLSDTIKYHDNHGCITSDGTISMKVYGDTTIYLGGCQYSGAAGVGSLTADGVAVENATALALKTAGVCGKNDETNVIAFAYTGGEAELVLTISGGSCYIPFIKVTTEVPKPDWNPIDVPVSIGTGADVLGSDSVTLTNTTDATDTHTVTAEGATLTLRTGTTYKLSTENNKIKATVGGKDSFKTGEEAAAVAIDVESLVVNPTVVCDGLAEGKKLSLSYMEGTTEKTIDLTVGEAVELWIGTDYTVKCDDETVEARVNDSTTFEAKAGMTELKVDLLSLANTVKMTVNGNLGSDKVIMTNADDATDVVTFGNGDSVVLKLNATYNLSCSNGDKFALIGGKQKYTVETAISELTVDITAAEYHTYDVWDFGAEELESTKYNTYTNHITVAFNQGLYGATAGKTGVNVAGFTVGGMTFNDGGYTTTHRWRSVNGDLVRWDGTPGGTDRIRKDPEGNVYNGYIYSNKSNTSDVNLAFEAKAGDIFTFLAGSNGNACTYSWATTAGAADAATAEYGKSANVEPLTFYATEDGTYYLWVSTNEKLVVARATRETPNKVTVSGSLTIPEGSDMVGGTLVFTQCAPDGTELTDIEVPITSNASYSATLSEQYSYKVGLKNKNGYIVDTHNTADNGMFSLKCSAGNQTVNVAIIAVDLVDVTGSLADLTAADAANLEMTFASDMVYVPEFAVKEGTNEFTAVLEKGVTYNLSATGVDDYSLDTATIMADADGTQNIKFTKKPVYDITVNMTGVEDTSAVELTFSRLTEALDGTLDGYVYTFTGIDGVQLRDGQYKVQAALEGYTQGVTADLKVNGAAATITINMEGAAEPVAYAETITVGADKEYQTINAALDAVRNMVGRADNQRVTIVIDPGNYEEMLYVDVPNVTLQNAAGDAASIELTNKGVDIAENAVRITGYYGHGYSYYSMNDNYEWDADTLAANKENGYESVTNIGSGSATMWNATVRIYADGFQADGIIFENSFNQYMSKKASEDVIVKQAGAKEGTTTRSALAVGSTEVQNKAYVERAAALAIGNNISDVAFDNCKFIGRQDTLYGGTNTYVEFNECAIYGAVDYIFGGMIAIFDKCDLVFNTSEDKNDLGYITAAQQKSGRGYLMLDCHITSTTPGVDTASQYTSKPGYLGRPWQGITSEVVYINTTVDAADAHWADLGASLITPVGWNSTLGGESENVYEYGTIELSGVDNSASRAGWANSLTAEMKLKDGVYVTKEAFRKAAGADGLYVIDISKGLKAGVDYDGGLSVLADMPMKSDGFIQGASNALGEDGKSAKDYAIPVSGSAFKIVAQNDGRFKIELKGAGGKDMYWVDTTDASKNDKFACNANVTKVYALEAGHTYYFYGNGTKPCAYSLSIDYRPYVAWSTVAAPTVGTPVAAEIGTENQGTITIPYAAAIGSVYSDSMDIRVFRDGALVDTVSITDETDPLKKFESSYTYTPDSSGSYTFQCVLRRDSVAGKNSEMSAAVDFLVPMADPVIVNIENQGSGAVKFSWQEVNEAESYEVYLDGELVATVTVPYHRFTGLTVGTEYEFGVKALGNGTVSNMTTMHQTVTNEAVKSWLYAAFGSGVDTKNNKVTDGLDSKDDTSLKMQSAGGKGKLVPNSTDGLAFYYTTIDPSTENFTLTADVTVDEWTYSNGQEGFGLMAADRVGVDGDSSTFWNNSYMASVTKVEYYWDSSTNTVSDSGKKYSMKLGVGSQEKKGVTLDNLADIEAGVLDDFSTKMTTLESSAPQMYLDAGTYNLVGNYTNDADLGDIKELKTFHLTIQRNNTGYFLSYTDENGVTTTNKYYHGDDGDELTKLDPNNIYVGFFASRNAKISVDNVQLTTINPADDAPAEERPITYVSPNYSIESAKFSNSADYEMVYVGNADGWVSVYYQGEWIVEDVPVKAEEKYRLHLTLEPWNNPVEVKFVPNPEYCPSKYERMLDYDTKYLKFAVDYRVNESNVIYVGPNARYSAAGTYDDPMRLDEAVMFPQPGDVIILKEGTYDMEYTVKVERGINGTAENNIYMIADPEATTRPVLDFGGRCAGMVLAGDYWYFQGFDVTNSLAGQKGIQVSGDYNTLDNLHAYRNGNTGIQISRYKGTDLWEDWPSNNLILNCTSYLNADTGYEDADGFAAKLTIADGNVFDGCIAAYNADDGWDLFAKVETGPIGQVKILNSIAFKNGYDIDEAGNEINAGNGNGFKMGGDSLTGKHILYNSIAFANKAKGIDSNSCPDILVYNSTSFDNKSYNVALYTNNASNTDYYATGILSYKKAYTEGENLKLKGLQDETKVYGDTNFYFNSGVSKNTNGVQVTDDWFVNMDTDAAIHGGITRNADGSINMNGYLEVTTLVPDGVGARMSGTASEDVVVPGAVDRVEDDEDDDDTSAAAPEESAPAEESKPATESKPAESKPATESKPAEETKPAEDSKPATETKPEDSKPAEIVKELIVDKDLDWNEVMDVMRDVIAEVAGGGKAILDVTLGKYHELSTDITIALMGTDVTLRLNETNGVVWEINGKDVTTPAAVDLKVDLESTALSADDLKIFEGAGEVSQFSIAHNGDFGFKANMQLPMAAANNGKFANLFWANNGSYEFVGSSKIADGYAAFEMDHASDYVVVVSDEAMTGVPAAADTATPGADATVTPGATAEAGSSNILPIILIIIAVLVVGGIAIAAVMMRKKK